MSSETQTQNPKPSTSYPDPTKPHEDLRIHKHMSKGWIFFIGFNIALPFIFAAAYIMLSR